jgi:hypothetical protein
MVAQIAKPAMAGKGEPGVAVFLHKVELVDHPSDPEDGENGRRRRQHRPLTLCHGCPIV